jgi:hypothetical protein
MILLTSACSTSKTTKSHHSYDYLPVSKVLYDTIAIWMPFFNAFNTCNFGKAKNLTF